MTEEGKTLKKIVAEKVDLNQSQKASQGEGGKSGKNSSVLNQKRTKSIAEKENINEENKSQISVSGEERKIIKAKRRFAGSEEAGKDETREDDSIEAPKGKFTLKSSFAEVAGNSETQFTPIKSFDFTKMVKKDEA